jgi:hypothetical protein
MLGRGPPRGWGVLGNSPNPRRAVDAGERVVTLLDLRMRGRSSGIEVALGKHAWVTTLRDGLMVRAKLHMSQAEAFEAVGLSE